MTKQNYLLIITFWSFIFIFPTLYAQSEYEWVPKTMLTGQKPECISCSPKYNFTIENFLRISISNNSDVIIKLCNYYTSECIRCVFISAGNTYEIKNIPEGNYIVKIAYGNNWAIKKTSNGFFCQGRFLNDALYEEGKNILDYNIIKYSDGYEVPSYEIKLEVRTHNKNNIFDSQKISEEEFFN